MDAVHLVNLRIPALDFSQSVASGVQIIEAYLICRKAIESLQPTLTSERRAIFESESHGPNLRASFKFPWSNDPVPASIVWLSWLRNILCILGILLWIIAALMDW
jgi:hypothetical protein